MSNNENAATTRGDSDNRSNRWAEHVLDRLAQVERDLAKHSMPWFRTPSNIISIVAVVVSVSIFSITYWSGKQETQFQKLQQIGQLIDQITALTNQETDLHRSNLMHSERVRAYMAIGNRRTALLNQLDRLLADVDVDSVSKLDLAVLSEAYYNVGRYNEAEAHLENFAKDEGNLLVQRVAMWRSLIGLYGYLGPEHVEDAKRAAEQGLALAESEKSNMALQIESIFIPYSLAFNLSMARRYDEAFNQLLEAERNAWAMPCLTNRQGFLTMVDTEILKILNHYPDGREDLLRSRANRANNQQQCLNDRVTVDTMSAAQNGETPSFSDYVGNYEFDTGAVAMVRNRADGVLEVRIGDYPALPLISVGDSIFAVSSGHYLVFQRSDTGIVTQILSLQMNGAFPAYRR